jgi:hypothetical protein
MVKVLQHIFEVLRAKDVERRSQGHHPRYWVVQDIDEFVCEFRASATAMAKVPWATVDFTTMYEALEHDTLIDGCMQAATEAWDRAELSAAAAQGLATSQTQLCLGPSGWIDASKCKDSPKALWLTRDTMKKTLTFMLSHLFVNNGGTLRRQVRGVPMGLECSPQLANVFCYAVESKWVDHGGNPGELTRRYIDDIFSAGKDALKPGLGFPSEEAYGMKYKRTSEDAANLIYLGVRFFIDDQGQAHCCLHDRAVEYPIHIQRYPAGSTVANPMQFAGFIMGRLVAAQRGCSRLDLFQDAVAGIFTHAFRRRYSRRLVHSVSTQFFSSY